MIVVEFIDEDDSVVVVVGENDEGDRLLLCPDNSIGCDDDDIIYCSTVIAEEY